MRLVGHRDGVLVYLHRAVRTFNPFHSFTLERVLPCFVGRRVGGVCHFRARLFLRRGAFGVRVFFPLAFVDREVNRHALDRAGCGGGRRRLNCNHRFLVISIVRVFVVPLSR